MNGEEGSNQQNWQNQQRQKMCRGAKVLRPDLASRPLLRPYQGDFVKTAVNILAQSL